MSRGGHPGTAGSGQRVALHPPPRGTPTVDSRHPYIRTLTFVLRHLFLVYARAACVHISDLCCARSREVLYLRLWRRVRVPPLTISLNKARDGHAP